MHFPSIFNIAIEIFNFFLCCLLSYRSLSPLLLFRLLFLQLSLFQILCCLALKGKNSSLLFYRLEEHKGARIHTHFEISVLTLIFSLCTLKLNMHFPQHLFLPLSLYSSFSLSLCLSFNIFFSCYCVSMDVFVLVNITFIFAI